MARKARRKAKKLVNVVSSITKLNQTDFNSEIQQLEKSSPFVLGSKEFKMDPENQFINNFQTQILRSESHRAEEQILKAMTPKSNGHAPFFDFKFKTDPNRDSLDQKHKQDNAELDQSTIACNGRQSQSDQTMNILQNLTSLDKEAEINGKDALENNDTTASHVEARDSLGPKEAPEPNETDNSLVFKRGTFFVSGATPKDNEQFLKEIKSKMIATITEESEGNYFESANASNNAQKNDAKSAGVVAPNVFLQDTPGESHKRVLLPDSKKEEATGGDGLARNEGVSTKENTRKGNTITQTRGGDEQEDENDKNKENQKKQKFKPFFDRLKRLKEKKRQIQLKQNPKKQLGTDTNHPKKKQDKEDYLRKLEMFDSKLDFKLEDFTEEKTTPKPKSRAKSLSNALSKFMMTAPKNYQTRRSKGKLLIDVTVNEHLGRHYQTPPSIPMSYHSRSPVGSDRNHLNFSWSPHNLFRTSSRPVSVTVSNAHVESEDMENATMAEPLQKLASSHKVFVGTFQGQSQGNPADSQLDKPKRYNRFLQNSRFSENSPRPDHLASNRQLRFIRQGSRRERFQSRRDSSASQIERVSSRAKLGLMSKIKSQEDLRVKLCVLFEKFIVYSSKIERLKLKITKNAGEGICYALFRRYCDPDSGELGLSDLREMLRSLDFPVDARLLLRIILFLNKFGQPDPDISDPPPLRYEHFRELFTSHRMVVPEVFLFCNWDQDAPLGQSLVPQTEYYLMRQILILTGRQLADVSRILQSLQLYEAHEVFGFLMRFENERRQLTQSDWGTHLVSFRENLRKPGKHPLYANRHFQSHQEIGLHVQNRPTGNPRNFSGVFTQSGRGAGPVRHNGQNESRRNGERLRSAKDRRGAWWRKRHSESAVNNVNLEESGSERELPVQVGQNSILEVSTFKNFLDFCKTQYLGEDLLLLMNVFGASEGFLDFDRFRVFFHSPIWNI